MIINEVYWHAAFLMESQHPLVQVKVDDVGPRKIPSNCNMLLAIGSA